MLLFCEHSQKSVDNFYWTCGKFNSFLTILKNCSVGAARLPISWHCIATQYFHPYLLRSTSVYPVSPAPPNPPPMYLGVGLVCSSKSFLEISGLRKIYHIQKDSRSLGDLNPKKKYWLLWYFIGQRGLRPSRLRSMKFGYFWQQQNFYVKTT